MKKNKNSRTSTRILESVLGETTRPGLGTDEPGNGTENLGGGTDFWHKKSRSWTKNKKQPGGTRLAPEVQELNQINMNFGGGTRILVPLGVLVPDTHATKSTVIAIYGGTGWYGCSRLCECLSFESNGKNLLSRRKDTHEF